MTSVCGSAGCKWLNVWSNDGPLWTWHCVRYRQFHSCEAISLRRKTPLHDLCLCTTSGRICYSVDMAHLRNSSKGSSELRRWGQHLNSLRTILLSIEYVQQHYSAHDTCIWASDSREKQNKNVYYFFFFWKPVTQLILMRLLGVSQRFGCGFCSSVTWRFTFR